MYQVVINDQYYVSDVDCIKYINGKISYIFNIELSNDKTKGKFFSVAYNAEYVAKQLAGKVIEYMEKIV